jgi:hypothetical protein
MPRRTDRCARECVYVPPRPLRVPRAPVCHADITRRLKRCGSRESRLDAIATMMLDVAEHPEMDDKIVLMDHLAVQAELTAESHSYVSPSKDNRPYPRANYQRHTVGLEFADRYPGAFGKVWALPVLSQEFIAEYQGEW